MRVPRHQNHLLINFLTNLGHRVRINHHRQWKPVIIGPDASPSIAYRVENTGGVCRVTIETADGDIHEGLFTNHSKLQYNKNFAVHVALQRAIAAMSIKNEADLENEEGFIPEVDFVETAGRARPSYGQSRQLQDNL